MVISAQSNTTSFIDDEAVVDNESEEDDLSSEDSDNDFIDNDNEARTRDSTPEAPLKLSRWNNVTDGELTDERLREIANDICNRHRGRTNMYRREGDDEEGDDEEGDDAVRLAALPTVEDMGIWRVRVIDGYERDVVLTLLLKGMGPQGIGKDVSSAFTRDLVQGFIYVEAASPLAVANALQGISRVIRTRGRLHVDLIPLEDRIPLLEMKTSSTTIQKNSWVKIKKRGSYNHDLGFVLDIDTNNLAVWVALVPRIAFDRKRKCVRPAAALFDKKHIAAVFGHNSIPFQDGYVRFKKDRYTKDGLLLRKFSFFDVIDTGFEITQYMLKLFRQCSNRAILNAVNMLFGDLQVDDRVRVVSGAQQGLVGRVVDIAHDGTLSFNCEMPSEVLHVLVHEVRRHFRTGDFVEVFGGEHMGEQGFVVQVSETDAELYIQASPQAATYKEGCLLEVSLGHIRFKAGHPVLNAQFSSISRNQSGSQVDSEKLKQKMYTGPDLYMHMEVRIMQRDAKLLTGAIVGSHLNQHGQLVVDVRTSTLPTTTILHVLESDVKELRTGLPIDKARWVPRDAFPSQKLHNIHNRCETTPPPSPSPHSEEDLPPAWSTSNSEVDSFVQLPINVPEPTPVTHTGMWCQWLLDSRLLNKRLDVRIHGTEKNLYRNGVYENTCGILVLTSIPWSADASVLVKVGVNQSGFHFRAHNVVPQLTTENAPIVTAEDARSVVSTIGQRVVIIGRDGEGKTDTLGCYGQIIDCPYPLAVGYACVAVNVPGSAWLDIRYFFYSSLCRSIAEPVEWSGQIVY